MQINNAICQTISALPQFFTFFFISSMILAVKVLMQPRRSKTRESVAVAAKNQQRASSEARVAEKSKRTVNLFQQEILALPAKLNK